MFEAIIVGAGPAGLSAARLLGRCCRQVLVCDAGTPRNGRSHALHGHLSRGGIAPLDRREKGREELARHGLEFRAVRVKAAFAINCVFQREGIERSE